MILLIIIYILLGLTSYLCLIRHFRLSGIYLLYTFISDILYKILDCITWFSKPYHDLGLAIFMVKIAIYLSPSLILAQLTTNISWRIVSSISFIGILLLIFCVYPTICGAPLLTIFTSYYITLSLLSLIILLKQLKVGFGVDKLLLILYAIGAIMESLLMNYLKFNDYYLVNLCNGIFYLITLLFVYLHPKVNRVLPL